MPGLFGIGAFALLVVVNHFGMIYDVTKETYDKKYKGNHSLNYKKVAGRANRISLTLPTYIKEKSDIDEQKEVISKYNLFSVLFWICLISFAVTYFLTL